MFFFFNSLSNASIVVYLWWGWNFTDQAPGICQLPETRSQTQKVPALYFIPGVHILRISREIFDHKRFQQVRLIALSIFEFFFKETLKHQTSILDGGKWWRGLQEFCRFFLINVLIKYFLEKVLNLHRHHF